MELSKGGYEREKEWVRRHGDIRVRDWSEVGGKREKRVFETRQNVLALGFLGKDHLMH